MFASRYPLNSQGEFEIFSKLNPWNICKEISYYSWRGFQNAVLPLAKLYMKPFFEGYKDFQLDEIVNLAADGLILETRLAHKLERGKTRFNRQDRKNIEVMQRGDVTNFGDIVYGFPVINGDK